MNLRRSKSLLLALITAAIVGCQSQVGGTSKSSNADLKGTDPKTYLANNGDLAHSLLIKKESLNAGKYTNWYLTVNPDGSWKGENEINTFTQSSKTSWWRPDKESAVLLTKTEIAQIADLLAKNDLATLPSTSRYDDTDPQTLSIDFGGFRASMTMNRPKEIIEIRERYMAIVFGVEAIVKKSAENSK